MKPPEMPQQPPKPTYWTPSRVFLAVAVAGLLVGGAAVAMPYVKEDTSSCQEVAEAHYREAIKATPDAEYHFWAGAAAEQLGDDGETCEAT